MIGRGSLFAQVLGQISRRDFGGAVRRHGAEEWAKQFSCWDQFVPVLYAQLAGANSLREICGGLAAALGRLLQLGMASQGAGAQHVELRQPASLVQRIAIINKQA